MEQSKVDRISFLPDEILINILSRLPISHACRTGLLSKRWKYLWTQVCNLSFFDDYDDIMDNVGPENGFFSFVDNVLDRCSSSNIKRFWLQFRHHNSKDLSRITRWFQFAVDHNAEDVVLMQHDVSRPIILPEILISYSPITKLKLKSFVIKGDHTINWPFLRSLSLRCMKLNNEEVERLLAGCPALETLEFSYYGFFRELRISSARLRKLTLESCFPLEFDYSEPWLDVYAPYLQHLEIYGAADCRLVSASSLSDATFDCDMKPHLVQDFLPGASRAKRLSFGQWLTEALSTLQLNTLSAVEFNCKQLVLRCHITRYTIYGIARFLNVLPHLDTLDIYLDSMSLLWFREQLMCKGAGRCNSNYNLNNVALNNLKELRICHVYGCCSKACFPFHVELSQFAEFVLSSATNLDRLCLISRRAWHCSNCSTNCGSHFFSQLATQLHHSPKSSPAALIHLSESNTNTEVF